MFEAAVQALNMEQLDNLISTPFDFLEDGTIRMKGTRVSFDSVYYAYKQGSSPESIVEQFPSLVLADVYSAISFYLNNQEKFNQYIFEREKQADEIEASIKQEYPSHRMKEILSSRLTNVS